ncbi:MAG: gliding motility-associated C-terminal domain-containing protein [Saprospiraceae bacterium]
MKLLKPSLLVVFFSTFATFLSAQNILISYTKSDSLVVCSTDTFTITIQNNLAAPLVGASLTISLPTGLTYVSGSVTGATQTNISNLSEPVFGLPDVLPAQTVTVKIVISADCLAADILDAGQLFIASISVSSLQGSAQVNTTSIPVETGAIVIQSVTGQLLMGERFDTLMRTICVKNTRLGKIGSLHFEDAHMLGFEASVVGAGNQSNTGTYFSADFDGSFFSSVGNGDHWLDLNESVCFIEKIVIFDCGIPAYTNHSTLRVGWGCGGSVCRYDSAFAVIEIKTSSKNPELVFEQVWAPPTNYCGLEPSVMGFNILNIGNADAKNIILNLILEDGLSQAGIKEGSFRIVTASGITPIAPSVFSTTVLNACGITVAYEASFLIPLAPANDTIQFLFDVLTCVEPCESVQPRFRADYLYTKDCPPNGFVSGNALIIPEPGYLIKGYLGVNIDSCMKSGLIYPFNYTLISQYFKEDGFMQIEFDLPHGIMLDSSCPVMLGNYAPILNQTTPLPNGGQHVHLAWTTPLPYDSIAFNFCLQYICEPTIVGIAPMIDSTGGIIYTDPCCFLKVKDQAYWSPALTTDSDCAIMVCNEQLLGVDLSICNDGKNPCEPPTDTTCCPPTPGLRSWWNAYRLNLGFQDNNDDRHTENSLPADLNLIRRDRFLTGDTLRVEFCAVMDPGNWTVNLISRAIWQEIVATDMAINGNDGFITGTARIGFTDLTKVRFLGNNIRVRYADGTEAFCKWNGLQYVDDRNYFAIVQPNSYPIDPIDEFATEKFFFLYSLELMFANGCLPKPMLAEGDSIFILSDFKMDVNYKPNSSNNPDPPLVGFRTASSAGGSIFAWNLQPHKKFQYSGWKKYYSPNTHSIKPCDNSVEVTKFSYTMRIARENLFPFEVRPLAWISGYRQTVPPGLELFSAKLDYLTLQESVPFYSNQSLSFSQSPGFLNLDFAPFFAEPVDEGFALRSNLTFKPNCQFSVADTSKQYIELSFAGCLNGDYMTTIDSIKNPIGYYTSVPKLKVLSGDSVVYAPSRTFEINFDLRDILASTASSTWIAVVSPSGQASNFELFQMPQNQLLSGINDFYKLGNINGFSQRSFRLKGKNIACETDTLMLIFGWGCTPISSLSEADCGRDTYLIRLQLERPELELDVLLEPASITLCDTTDWFEFEIYNANIGYAYDLKATVKLPQGLRIIPGNCQISYPEGAPWLNIADPELFQGNFYQWKINDILAILAANGLPGENFHPANSFHIRFKAIAECGYVANTPIIYGTTGLEPCGRQANTLNKPGAALNIIGINPAYSVQVSIQPVGNPGLYCGESQTFSASLNILGTPTTGDSVYVLLPQGVIYQPNSYDPGLNAPPGPVTSNINGFQIPLPILVGGGTMQFQFTVNFESAAGCVDQIMLVQTRLRTMALCQSLGAPCEVFVATGEALWNFQIEHPQLSASNAGLSISNGLLNANITVTNIGTIPSNGATVQIWRDVDGSGSLTAADILLQTNQTSAIIAPGASLQLSGLLPGLDSTQLCGLMFVLPADENCACTDQVLVLDNFDLMHTALTFCLLNPVPLGVPAQSGFSYQWLTNAGLSCLTCSNAVFTPDPNTPNGTTLMLTLVESSSTCIINHTFELTFGAASAMIEGPTVICEGSTTTLVATPSGASYFWEGPGIQNPGLPTQTIQGSLSSLYSVTITYSNGCTAVDTLEITVLYADTVQLSGLSTCAGEPVNVLGTITAMPGTYQIILKNMVGCDSTVVQTLEVLPEQITEEQRLFCAGDSLLVFDSLFTQSGSIAKVFTAFNGCDSTHLINVVENQPLILTPVDTIFGTYGNIITLSGPNGYLTYTWEPAPAPPCSNCPSVTYLVDSTGYQEYLLTVTDVDGCPGELVFRVVVFPPCSADSLRIPNAFTPNGDGYNDVFRVVKHEGAEVVSSLEIYDRWGEKVYENQGNAFWDGTIDGQPAPSDVYVYIVKLTCGELVGKRVGDVTLLR